MPRLKLERSVILKARGQDVPVFPSVVEGLPDAQAFLHGLLDYSSMAVDTAIKYVKFVSRLKRTHRLDTPDLIKHAPERSAANAYHKWRARLYASSVETLAAALDEKPEVVMRLRVHSLVPPSAGKIVPGQVNPLTGIRAYDLHEGWTLHVPLKDGTPVHVDPCQDLCRLILVTDVQLEAIAKVFEWAWGTRDIWHANPSARLIGDPPLASYGKAAKHVEAVALSEHTNTSEAIVKAGGTIVREVDTLLEHLRSYAVDGVYLARTTCTGRLDEVLQAIREAWTK